MRHKKVVCDVRGCKEEATRWFDTAQVSGDFDMRGKHTTSERSLYYSELAYYQDYFSKLARRFGLVEEFKENGII